MRILINLLSEQMLPNFIAVMEVRPDRVHALATPDFRWQVEVLEEVAATPHEPVPIPATDLRKGMQAVAALLESIPGEAEVVVNFTGGTKIMALSAVLPALQRRRKQPIRLVYVDSWNECMDEIGFDAEGRLSLPEPRPLTVHIPFGAYLGLLGERMKSFVAELDSDMAARLPAAQALASSACDGFFSDQRKLFDGRALKAKGRIEFKEKRRDDRLPRPSWVVWDRKAGEISLPGGDVVAFPSGGAAFLAGGWLEEHVFSLLLQSGLFRQVLARVEIPLPESVMERMPWAKHDGKNELDVVVCDGVHAAIVECKAGAVSQDHLNKLNALRQHFLGSHGVALMVCRHRPQPAEEHRARELGIALVCGRQIARTPAILKSLFTTRKEP